LCDVTKCYNKAVEVWTTGGGTKLYVCEEHAKAGGEQMGKAYFYMNPKHIEELT